MKTKHMIISWLGSILIASSATWYITRDYYNKPIPNPNDPVATPVVSKPVERPKDLECELAKDLLYHYDNDPFVIEWKTLKQTRTELNLGITGNLFERSFSQEAAIPIIQSSSGNWKLYLGFGIGTIATAGAVYGGYKIFKLLK
jgi:hypothetical protein